MNRSFLPPLLATILATHAFFAATAVPVRLRAPGLAAGNAGTPAAHGRGKTGGAGPAADAAGIVEALAGRLGIEAKASDFAVRLSDTDRFGRRHVRLTQLYNGIEVDGRELVVHFDRDGSVYEINGEYLGGLSLPVEPAVQKDGAALVVYCAGRDAAAAKLAWRFREGRYIVFMDARTGETLHRRRAAPHAKLAARKSEWYEFPFDYDALIRTAAESPLPEGAPATVTGRLPDQQGGAEVTVAATESPDGTKYLAATRADGIEIGVLDGFLSPRFRDAAKRAYTRQDAAWFAAFPSLTGWTAFSGDDACGGDDIGNALAIAFNISTVLDYYRDAFGRRSYDGRGGRVAAWRFWQDDPDDVDSGYANAFWTSQGENTAKTNGCFFFGYDLKGRRSETSLDTCGHELTHGITSWTADLVYEGEPGALNESFSDIIGVACEFAAQPLASAPASAAIEPGAADWLFDEDSGSPARSLSEPKRYRQPSRYRGRMWIGTSDVTESNDSGGVHSNSGVQNHFFYLLSEGGKGENEGIAYDLKGIGVRKAVQIAYLALTAYCTPNTDYAAVKGCWDSAAQDLLASGVIDEEDYAAVAPAWDAVMTPVPAFDGSGEILYVYAETGARLVVKSGKVNSRGRFKVTAALTVSGKTYKFSGYAAVSLPTVALKNSRLGTLFLTLAATGADATLLLAGRADGLSLSLERFSPAVEEVAGLDALRVGVAVSGKTGIDAAAASVRYAARKLPSGVRVDAKTGNLKGVPRKAGRGTATFTAKCRLRIPGEKRLQSVAPARKADWNVAALHAFAQGKFAGSGIAVTVSKTGKISGTVKKDGKKYRVAAKSYQTFDGSVYGAGGSAKGYTFQMSVDAGGMTCRLETPGGSAVFTAAKGK